jgi:hypothetical protein
MYPQCNSNKNFFKELKVVKADHAREVFFGLVIETTGGNMGGGVLTAHQINSLFI